MTIIQGSIIGGRYQISAHLGNGGFGTTFLAQDMQQPGNPECVVKQLTPQCKDPDVLETAKKLFKREAVTLKELGKHDQIPTLLAYIEENKEFYLVEEFIDGDDLSEELKNGTRLSEAEVTQILCQILEVLVVVHHKYVHRDIKPSNLRRRSSDKKIVLLDFGAVKEICVQTVNLPRQTAPTIIGTDGYMPYEQKRGCPVFSSDIYAVGIIGIEALTGINPCKLEFDNNNEIIWRHYAQVSDKLANILDRMVRYDSTQRYQSAPEILKLILGNTQLQISSKTITLPPQIKPKKPLFYWGLGILILTVAAGSLLWQIFKPVSQNFRLYENTQQGIKIKYPEKWERRDAPNVITQEIASFISPKQGNQDSFQEVATVSVENFSGTLDESLKIFSDEIKNNSGEINILEPSEITMAGRPARQLVFTSQVDKNSLKTLQVWALNGNKAYVLTYTADVDDYNKFHHIVEEMIESFEINYSRRHIG